MLIRTSMRLLGEDKTIGSSSLPFRWLMGLLFLLGVWTGSALAAAPATAPGQSATLLPDGHWLLVGGEGNTARTAWLFDASTRQRVALPAGPANPRGHHSAVLLPDGQVLVLGGFGVDGAIVSN